ncbi:MAG: conjugal transfer protein TraI [Ferruginibacter sp.]|nr:conjugal transfer protein TraI [Ferruginibacter sp.]
MKKIIIIMILSVGLSIAPTKQSHAVVWVVVQAAVKKIIKAMDLAIQRLQNKTIWLQNAQKTLENTMSKLKLDEISDWVEKQRTLYKEYYEELHKVKSIIAYYQRIKNITQKQVQLVNAYKRAYNLFKKDTHFTPAEIVYMEKIYEGILDASLKNIDQIFLVINSFSTQMTDAKRLEIINAAAEKIDQNYVDLVQFNMQNKLLSLHRAKDQREVDMVKALYGIR